MRRETRLGSTLCWTAVVVAGTAAAGGRVVIVVNVILGHPLVD